MQKQIFILFLSLLVTFDSSWAANDTLPSDWLQGVQFSENEITQKAEFESSQFVGLVNNTLMGWGLIYNREIAPHSSLWTLLTYTGKNLDTSLPPDTSSPDFVISEITEKNKIQWLAGYDYALQIPWTHRWNLLLGAAAGLNQSKSEATHYMRGVLSAATYDKRNEFYIFTSARIGIQWKHIHLWGMTGNISWVLSPVLLRTPQEKKWIGPDSREVKWQNFTPYFIEATIQL